MRSKCVLRLLAKNRVGKVCKAVFGGHRGLIVVDDQADLFTGKASLPPAINQIKLPI